MIKRFFTAVLLLLLAIQSALCDAPVAKQFLQFMYGAEGLDTAKICLQNDDLWMLPGSKDTNGLLALDAEKFDPRKRNGIVSGVLAGETIYFIELKDGKVDPIFMLDGVKNLQRQKVLLFLYHSLTHNKSALEELTTDPSKVEIVGKKAAPGDMDQYGSVIEMFPVIRASSPSEDAKTKTITYRVPLGENGLSLKLVKVGSTWKIDTSKKVTVPLEFFFREEEGGRRVR
jgi:hypothetical protein